MKNYLRYLYAILAVLLIVLLRFALHPLTGPGIPFITLFPITVLVALLAGLGPALLTGILGAIIADYFFIGEPYSITIDVAFITRTSVVILTSALVGYVGDMLRAARNELEIRVKERTVELSKTNEQLKEENLQRLQSEQSLRLEEARLDVLLSLSRISEASLDEITNFTLEQAIALTHSKIGFIGFLNKEETVYTLHSVSKDVVKECDVEGNPAHWPVAEAGIWADAVRQHRTIFINDYSKPHPRKKGIPSGHVPIERFMIVPVFEDEKIVTLAGVGNKASDYDKTDERQLVLLLSGMWSYVQKNRSRELLLAERQRFNDVLETLPVYVCLLTPDHYMPFANKVFRDLFGYYPDKRCYEFLFDRSEPCQRCETYKVLKTNKPQRWEWTGPNGRIFDVFDFPFKDTNESQLILEMGIDITEKKIAEAELEKYRLHLEDIVKQRTEELARSNNDLEQFAYVASHDLQEPLRAVSGFVSLLNHQLQESLNDKTKEYMHFTIDGVHRMQSLINGLLEYSRIDTRGKPPEKTDSSKPLEDAILSLQTSINESGAKITHDKLPTVNIDPIQLTQLFQNLIGNAIKFRSESPLEVHISASHKDKAWQFAVKDNGIGIEQQYAERIFLIFQRLHTRKQYPGTGIGLSLCKKIVERHGGKIRFESEPGKGSTFYFTIPDLEGENE